MTFEVVNFNLEVGNKYGTEFKFYVPRHVMYFSGKGSISSMAFANVTRLVITISDSGYTMLHFYAIDDIYIGTISLNGIQNNLYLDENGFIGGVNNDTNTEGN